MDGALIISSSGPIRHWAPPNYIINQFKQSTFSAATHIKQLLENLCPTHKKYVVMLS